ncbi:MAG: hypothetical protein ABIK89_21330 [Planctomycetota bacterium]
MSDYEIDEIRRIRHQVSAEHGHDLRKVAEYYRNVEEKLRESGRYQFADEEPRKVQPANTKNAT